MFLIRFWPVVFAELSRSKRVFGKLYSVIEFSDRLTAAAGYVFSSMRRGVR